MYRGAVLRGDAEHFNDFPVGGAGGVVDAHAFRQRALSKTFVDSSRNFGELFGRSSAMGRFASGKHSALRVAHNFHADGSVADAYAEIDERLPFPEGIPTIDVFGASFKFEGGGHTIARLIFVIARFLAVFM